VSQPWLTEAVGTAEWTGTRLAPLLREVGIGEDAVDVVFTGADHGVERGVEQDYQRALPVAEALREEALLAYAMNGAPLPPQHGFPLRLVIPGWYGMAHVKWLQAITVLGEPFEGYQNTVAYRFTQDADEPGDAVSRMRPRALMIPPGHPDFMSRIRFLAPGVHELTGRAWSGRAAITRVEVSVDGGQSWMDAEVEPAPSRWAWSRWRRPWTVERPGRYALLVRATDATGEVQPVDQPWNRQGMGNNMAQRVTVVIG
jgi:DMSO/TMAO reductase YedYZ molybdopterin-dependent catalytic subunit